jgi:hypothetical protein
MQISIGPEQVNELILKLQDAIAAGNAPEAVLVDAAFARCTPCQRQPDNSITRHIPGEMLTPDLASRIEEPDDLTSLGIERRDLVTLMVVA